MSTQISTTSGWEIRGYGKKQEWDSLTWNASQPLPELGPTDVLVKFHAAALNFRDAASKYSNHGILASPLNSRFNRYVVVRGAYVHPPSQGLIPGSDGAGEVLSVGEKVLRFQPGDKVIVFTYQSGYFGMHPGPEAFASDVRTVMNGVLRQHGVFNQGLVYMPAILSFEEGAAVNTAFITAWAALMGGIRPLRVGGSVLVQGTGGVSVAALQIAAAAGATVVATTSSSEKAQRLKKLGASHIINYREYHEWGVTAKKLSPGGKGFFKVIEISGGESCKQSFEALARGGEIDVIGFIASAKNAEQNGGVAFFDTILRSANIRGVQGGSRQLPEEVNHVIDSRAIKPALGLAGFRIERA
ncbi:hypothetical protein F5884DRAFT_897310 [Xylogone sp. PMI_703]|nr:hypothetical protein F5884DRAFT_897310 [Xylogone sp. PMI_703]